MRLILVVLMGSMVGCATMKQSLIVGASSGAATGAMAGSTIADKNKGQASLQGALIGGAIGGIASYFIHGHLDKRDDRVRRETLFNLEKFNVSTPASFSGASGGPGVAAPRVEMQWVDTQVQGKKLIEGHRVWIMTEDAQWIPSPGQSR